MDTKNVRNYALAIRAMVVDCLAEGSGDLFHIQAHVGFDLGATHEQVRYAVRVLSKQGHIGYNPSDRIYYLISRPEGQERDQ